MTGQSDQSAIETGEGSALDDVLFLARAESRVKIVGSLLESGAATQRELRTRLDVSRTTTSRALQSLTARNWVEKTDGQYRLTRMGRIVVSEFTDLLGTIETARDRSEFLRWFPADVDAPDFLGVDDVELTYSTDGDPYAPARKQSEILHSADRLRVLLPAIDLNSTRTITEQVVDRGLEVETIVSSGVESTIETEEFASLIREKIETGRSTMLVARESLPFYLGLADDSRVQICLADEEGFPRALLETTDAEVREWAERVYRRYRDRARPKPAEEF